MLLITYQESVAVRNLSTLRSNFETCPYAKGHPGMQPAAVQQRSSGSGLCTIYKIGWVTYGHFCIPGRYLGHLQTALGYCVAIQNKRHHNPSGGYGWSGKGWRTPSQSRQNRIQGKLENVNVPFGSFLWPVSWSAMPLNTGTRWR